MPEPVVTKTETRYEFPPASFYTPTVVAKRPIKVNADIIGRLTDTEAALAICNGKAASVATWVDALKKLQAAAASQ